MDIYRYCLLNVAGLTTEALHLKKKNAFIGQQAEAQRRSKETQNSDKRFGNEMEVSRTESKDLARKNQPTQTCCGKVCPEKKQKTATLRLTWSNTLISSLYVCSAHTNTLLLTVS